MTCILPECEVEGSIYYIQWVQGKYLTHWWRGELIASWPHVLLKRTFRRLYSSLALGLFKVIFGSLSTRLILVVTVLVYGCEDWIVTDRILEQLEACLEEWALRWPIQYSCNYCSGDGICKGPDYW